MDYIKIQQLEEINNITQDDYLIIETQNGTKKIKTNIIKNQDFTDEEINTAVNNALDKY